MNSAEPAYVSWCDSCHRPGWDVRVYRPGHATWQYCVKCFVGVLVDVRDAQTFVVRNAGGELVMLNSLADVQVWLLTEPLGPPDGFEDYLPR